MLGRPEEAAEDEGLRPEGIIPRHSQLRFLQGNIFSVINSGIKEIIQYVISAKLHMTVGCCVLSYIIGQLNIKYIVANLQLKIKML